MRAKSRGKKRLHRTEDYKQFGLREIYKGMGKGVSEQCEEKASSRRRVKAFLK